MNETIIILLNIGARAIFFLVCMAAAVSALGDEE